MIYIHLKELIVTIVLLFTFSGCVTRENGQEGKEQLPHPVLLLSKSNAKKIASLLGKNKLLDNSFYTVKNQVDQAIKQGVIVPVPKDAGGGYTHEQHKKNGKLIYGAGLLFQITGEKNYAKYVKDILLAYAKMYPALGLHPKHKNQSPGKLFWQSLNDCVWLVYSIQGYDFIYSYLNKFDRIKIEEDLFLPMADFLSEGSPKEFNRIHNHGTWAVAAVGMTGYVLGNDDLVQKSLRGLNKDDKGGFLVQLDSLFSPDGYYTEGPYYQRYAMMPFVIFAEAIQHNNPGLKIFRYNNCILKKAVEASLQLTYTNGAFFPLNDAIKEKTFETVEMIYAVNIAYEEYGQDYGLLDISERQKKVTLTNAGLRTALDWKAGKKQPFHWHSVFLSDGPRGDEGGIGILRSGNNDDESCLLMKYTSLGLSHGHYDKMEFIYYDHNTEILRDYGAVRFLNIEAKYGGRYLPENKSWAKQSIAHNTLTVDETCQYNGNYNIASKTNPLALLFSDTIKNFQYMSAYDTSAYPGVMMYRTMIMAQLPSLTHPVIIDVFKVMADKLHQYDLPFYYNGQCVEINFPVSFNTRHLDALGNSYGYQHLWLNGKGESQKKNAQITWLVNNRFYTLTALTDKNTEILFTTIGANDPHFNLRNESAIMLRESNAKDHLFVNVIEPHGKYDPVDESTKFATSNIGSIITEGNNEKYIRIRVTLTNGKNWEFNIPADPLKAAGQAVTLQEISTNKNK